MQIERGIYSILPVVPDRNKVTLASGVFGHAVAVVLAGPDDPTRAKANALLGRVGMRLMTIDGKIVVGLWSDLDSSQVRAALAVFHPDGIPSIRYLDGVGVPMRYKERRVPGELVPLGVLHAMGQTPATPWTVRDQLLKQMGWRPGSQSRRARKAGTQA